MADKSLVDDDTIKALSEYAVEKAQSLAPTKKLKTDGVIQAQVIRHKDGTVTIQMWADILKAPEARAFEKGSGLHRQPGSRLSKNQQPDGTILIKPRNKKFLAFKWDKISSKEKRVGRILHFKANPDWRDRKDTERFPSYVGELPDGRSLFNYVHHPGVAAANDGLGYLRLGAGMALESYSARFASEAGESIIRDIKASFAKRRTKR